MIVACVFCEEGFEHEVLEKIFSTSKSAQKYIDNLSEIFYKKDDYRIEEMDVEE